MAEETLRDIIEGAKETLIEITNGGENAIRKGAPTDDHISAVADGAVPVYTYDIITVYRSSSILWEASPDIVMDRNISVDAVISRAIYEAVQQALDEYVQELAGEPVQCTVDDCGEDDDHLDTDNETCIEHCDNSECDECYEPEED